jgi:glycosyltransferase involved in cell wall biosynthesis
MRRTAAVQVVSGLEIAHGGPSYSVPRLNGALIAASVEGTIFADLTPGDLSNGVAEAVITFDRSFGNAPFLRKLHISADMQRRLLGNQDRFDIVHSHGLWRMPNIYAARAARRHNIPHIISPRGMLSPVALSFSRSSKGLFWRTMQKAAVLEAACLHATSQSEHDEFRALGIRRPIAILPNGIDLPDASHLSSPRGGAPRTLLFFGRIHPKKGLDMLILAWVRIAARYPGWRLRIVGPGEPAHLLDLKLLVATRQAPRISIEGPVYGEAKWRIYSEADLFVLPTYNENFGLTVAESLACRRPVIVTKGAPWAGVETHRCGWWVDANEHALADGLTTALSMPADVLDAMGRRGEAWMRQAFAWNSIGVEMARIYDWALGHGERPDCVYVLEGDEERSGNER